LTRVIGFQVAFRGAAMPALPGAAPWVRRPDTEGPVSPPPAWSWTVEKQVDLRGRSSSFRTVAVRVMLHLNWNIWV